MKSKQISPAVAVVVIAAVLLIVAIGYWWFSGSARRTTETMQPGVSPYPPGYVPGGVASPPSGAR